MSPTPISITATRETPESRPVGLLRCVSSGYLSGGCSCQATIPIGVVAAAWARDLEQGGAREDRFFRFSWQDGDWLAFGLHDGRVRGVYCPEHSAERAVREFGPLGPLAGVAS
jgi:hypothetical protein